jgi:hypothetical protein
MKLSTSGKLFFGGLALCALGEAMERIGQRAQERRRKNAQKFQSGPYTPESVILYLTDEQIDYILSYSQERGITFQQGLEHACAYWNELASNAGSHD